jgi:hypothetical protein
MSDESYVEFVLDQLDGLGEVSARVLAEIVDDRERLVEWATGALAVVPPKTRSGPKAARRAGRAAGR